MKKILFCGLLCGAACLPARPVSAKPKATPAPTTSPVPTVSASPVPTPNLPPGPLLKPVPDYTRWTVTTNWKGLAETPSPTVSNKKKKKTAAAETHPKPAGQIITGEKVGAVIHVSTTTDNGTEERWSDGKVLITTNTAWKVPIFSVGTPEEFPRPAWISRNNIKEIKKQGDREIWVFRDRVFSDGQTVTAAMLRPGEKVEDFQVDATAVIDAFTGLPESVQIGDQLITYKFDRLPLGVPLEMPYEIRKAISDHEFDSSYQSSGSPQTPQVAPRP